MVGYEKPPLIVVAAGIDPGAGSEGGKGWWWSRALSAHFALHVITQEEFRQRCLEEPLVHADGWTFHATPNLVTNWRFPRWYVPYARWLGLACANAKGVAAETGAVGLCHLTIGSFRVLPRYDRLGLPYVLGPLGGGERAPLDFVRGRPAPVTHKLAEAVRPVLNDAFAVVPRLRACLRGASLVLTTSEETERTVRRMGAVRTAVVFPDSYDVPIDVDAVVALRERQAEEVAAEIRLLWQGGPAWSKAPDLALLLLRHARAAGTRVRLTMVGRWDGGALSQRLGSVARDLDVAEYVTFAGWRPREAFLELAREHHAFVATSLHDSGGIPLIEAQAQGLPCLTPGFGGNRQAASPDAGVAGPARTQEEFFNAASARLVEWQRAPAQWLEDCGHAVRFAAGSGRGRIESYVRELIVPVFHAETRAQAAVPA